MKKSVYSIVLGGVALLALSACVETATPDTPGGLYRKQVIWLRGDGYAIQRYEACPQGMMHGERRPMMMEGERHGWHHRHHHHHKDGVKTESTPKKEAVKKEAPKKDEKKSDKASDKKDSKKDSN